MNYKNEWITLADIKKDFAQRDWFMGTSGNLALRLAQHPAHFLVTASGKDKTKITPEDFLVVDLAGQAVSTTLKPSAETLLHCEIFSHTKAQCSLHVHTVANNVVSDIFAKQQAVTFQGNELIKAFDIWEEDAQLTIPIVKNAAHIPTLAASFIPHLTSDRGAVLIHNHGITAWGRTALEAKKIVEAVEFLCQCYITTATLRRNL